MDYHNDSFVQHYAIKVTDSIEYYFRGDRFLESQENYLLKTVRYLSFLTILPPVSMALVYLVANWLVKPDDSDASKSYWEDKIVFPLDHLGRPKYDWMPTGSREKIIELFRKSGIQETRFEKVVIVPIMGDDHHMIYTADGHFPRFPLLYPDVSMDQVLTIKLVQCEPDASKSTRIAHRASAIVYTFNAKMKSQPLYFCELNAVDFQMMNLWSKIPNEVKQLLTLDPDEDSVYKS